MRSDTNSPARRDLRWLFRRLRREYYAPTRTWSATSINAYLDARAAIFRPFHAKAKNPVAVYDLRICANTFDFAYFLYDADTYFRALGFDRFQVCILDDELVDMGHEYERVVSWEKRRHRVKAILVPMAEMYQGCSAVRVTSEAKDVIELCRGNEPIFPHRADGRHLRTHVYKTIYPKLMQQLPYSGFRAPRVALDEVARYKARLGIVRPAVSLTVRAYAYQPLRNTDVGVYFGFADYLRSTGFEPIFIPDAEAPKAVDFRGFASFEEACADLRLRTAMYEDCFTNVFTSNGVHAMAGFNERSSLMIAMLNEHYESNTGTARWEAEGLRIGDQYFNGTTKRIIWAKETVDNLIENFEIIRSCRPLSVKTPDKIDTRELS